MQFSLNYKFFSINICKGLYSAIKKCIAHRKTKRGERGDCQMTWSEFAVSLFMAVIVAAIRCEIAWTNNYAYKAHMSISYCIYFFVISLYYLYIFYNFLLITRNKNFKLCFSDTALFCAVPARRPELRIIGSWTKF